MPRVGSTTIGGSFGSELIAVERGLAEFRAGRPVLFAGQGAVIAVPVDGLDASRLQWFKDSWAATPLRLVLTAQRARALGTEAEAAITVGLSAGETLAAILSFAADAKVTLPLDAAAAEPAAVAAIDLAKLAGRLPVLLIGKPISGSPAIPGEIVRLESAAVAGFRRHLAGSLSIAASSLVPVEGADAVRFVVFRDAVGGNPAALIYGSPDFSRPVLVRLHSACLTGDVFGSRRCDCGDQLKLAMGRVSDVGGVILYLEQEGRGLGLVNKLRAYGLQDRGLDTVDANLALGFEDDERDYRTAARMLQLLGCRRVVLLTNNPIKLDGLSAAGVEICGSMALQAPIKPENRRYLAAKAMRAGHRLDHLWSDRPAGEPIPARRQR